MTAQQILDRYAAAGNGHDPEGLAGCFGAEGTYEDPATGQPLRGADIAGHARALFGAFPDVHFDIPNVVHDSERSLAFEWLMRATHGGPYAGVEATGRQVALPGADFLALDDDGIAALRGYFDPGALLRQIGAG